MDGRIEIMGRGIARAGQAYATRAGEGMSPGRGLPRPYNVTCSTRHSSMIGAYPCSHLEMGQACVYRFFVNEEIVYASCK
jgi:hypothetical protein